ncbi:hypothetical protein ZTR_04248 [Talaromyces verruculosus]|nr:hypothetical protein ZTR_04248 [Talaromyces verruculosus]
MARASDVPMSEPVNPAKRKRIWEDNDDEATRPPSAQRVKIKDRLSINNLIEDRLSINQLINGKDGSENATSTQGSTPKRSPYGKNGKPSRNNRGKHLSPGFRPGHISSTNAKRTGLFSPEEIETLEQFKLEFCNKYHITGDMFDASVQSVRSSKNGIFLENSPIVEYKDFWAAIYETIPVRDQKSINRFCRRHFSNAYKPHQWTKEDDDELERLQAIHGTKWANIARDMERTYDDVVQRWKNKVELRHTMKTGPWDDDEIYKLLEQLEKTRQQHLAQGKTEEEVGREIYEMPDEFCYWGSICKKFEGTRSRQQLADKWRKVKRIVLERRAVGNEDAVWDPSLQPRPGRRPKYKPLPVQSQNQKFKSSETVDSSDEAEDQNGGPNERGTANGNKEQPAKVNSTSQPGVNESTNESPDSSSEDDSDDESSSDEEENAAENGDKDSGDEVVDESAGDETPRPKTNGYHEASDNESVVPESQFEESQASSSRSLSLEVETNGHRQPSEELGIDPVSAREDVPEGADKDIQASDEEDSDEDIEPATSQSKLAKPATPAKPAGKQIKSPIIKQEERHSSPAESSSDSESNSDSDSDSDGSSSNSSSEDESEEESEEELSPEEIEKKIFKFKKEPEDD